MKPRPLVLLLIVVAVGALFLMPVPPTGRAVRALQDLVHVPLAAVLVLVVLAFLRRSKRLPGVVQGPAAFALTTVFLAGIEIVQPLVGRSRSFADLVTGALAAAATVLVVLTWPRRGGVRALGLVLGLALVVVACLPALRVLYDCARQSRDLPLLASFEDDLEMTRWWFQDAEASRVPDFATKGRRSLRVALQPGRYPAATFAWPSADWLGWTALRFDVRISGTAALPLIVKIIDEEHDGTYEDAFHAWLRLEPGRHAVSIPMAEVEHGSRRRSLDLEHIESVQFLVDGLEEERVIHLDDVRLVRAD